MASKTTPNVENLAALGAERLAQLLADVAEGDPAIKRRLRLELVAKSAPAGLAKEVRKRLSSLARAESFVDRRGISRLASDLEDQRRAIVDRVAKIDAGEALELMWRFIGLASSVHDRADDGSGVLVECFRAACRDLGALAAIAKPEPVALADRVFTAVNENDYGQYDDLIALLAPCLGSEGLGHLKSRIIALSQTPVPKPRTERRRIIGWSSDGPMFADAIEESARKHAVRYALQAIADAQGDVDGFIATFDDMTRKAPRIAVEIARRLATAGRAEDAMRALDAAEHHPGRLLDPAWQDMRIEVLDALGQGDAAQAARWSLFERTLSPDHLRAYLKRLPDFEDVEAERRALDHAEGHADPIRALAFLVSWRVLDRAARLVLRRAAELDGNLYEVLTPAADALSSKYPLAATMALRAMIEFALAEGRASRYRHAARHFMECISLATRIPDYGAFESHNAYGARLKARHGRKSGFWPLIV